MHRIKGENAPVHGGDGQVGLESTDLILFETDIAVPQDRSRRDFITAQLMHRLLLFGRGSDRFPVDSQVPMIGLG